VFGPHEVIDVLLRNKAIRLDIALLCRHARFVIISSSRKPTVLSATNTWLLSRGVPRGAQRPRALKNPTNVASTIFNTVHLLPVGAKFVSCPRRHLTSVLPCCYPPPNGDLHSAANRAQFVQKRFESFLYRYSENIPCERFARVSRKPCVKDFKCIFCEIAKCVVLSATA